MKKRHKKKQKKEKRHVRHAKKEQPAPAQKIPVLNAAIGEAPVRVSRPKINLQICQNNYNCIVYCPHNAISRNDKGRPVIDYNLCTGCMICLRECPTGAIFEERE